LSYLLSLGLLLCNGGISEVSVVSPLSLVLEEKGDSLKLLLILVVLMVLAIPLL